VRRGEDGEKPNTRKSGVRSPSDDQHIQIYIAMERKWGVAEMGIIVGPHTARGWFL
jgi:hypothetical protein